MEELKYLKKHLLVYLKINKEKIMKIYDCFSYWDEDLLLDLRLNILNDYKDYFVIVED